MKLAIIAVLLSLLEPCYQDLHTQKSSQKTLKNLYWNKKYITYKSGDQQLKLCPDNDVMKARYQCFTFDVQQVKKAAGVSSIEQLYGMYNPGQCQRVRSTIHKPQANMPSPQGGFNNLQYTCIIPQKP